jgi:hypothetical protein
MLGHIEMQYLPTTVFQYDEHEQHLHRDRGHREEINRHELAEVVARKRLPRLGRRPVECSENSGDGALGDFDAEHLELAMNPWRTPERVGRRRLFDPPANRGSGGRPASPTARQFGQPRPEPAEPFALPLHDGVRLYLSI